MAVPPVLADLVGACHAPNRSGRGGRTAVQRSTTSRTTSPPDPYLRFDTCDYSLHPGLVGRRVEARVTDREITAVALDTGELACRHARSFARHRTITALEHARVLKVQREQRRGAKPEPEVEVRSLDVYDQLIA